MGTAGEAADLQGSDQCGRPAKEERARPGGGQQLRGAWERGVSEVKGGVQLSPQGVRAESESPGAACAPAPTSRGRVAKGPEGSVGGLGGLLPQQRENEPPGRNLMSGVRATAGTDSLTGTYLGR